MKILELRFKNLNSLYGEWLIDFSAPEYVTNGIFAITGSTGAGKSTVLDAICLALYGQTPRLGRITKSGNEIMSRQTGECYAEVLFESSSGRFRCHWSQHRARKSASGDLQSPQHEISEGIENGQVIENQLRSVATAIEEKTGMDFDRFTRSILLAQGDFDTFLKANIEEKSKILEQITGTEIYTEISKRVHERQRSERENLNNLQAETDGIIILEPEEEKNIQLHIKDQQKQERKLSTQTSEIGKSIAWLTGIDDLKKDIDSLSEESEKLEVELESFQADRSRLDHSIKAAELDGTYANLGAVRKQQGMDENSLTTANSNLPGLEDDFQQHADVLKTFEQQVVNAKAELKIESPLIKKVRLLDQKLIDQKKTITNNTDMCEKDSKKIEESRKLKLVGQNNRDSASNELKIVDKFLSGNAQDEWLVSGLTGISEQISSLLSKQKETANKIDEVQEAEDGLRESIKKLEDYTKETGVRKQIVEGAAKSLKASKKVLSSLLGDRLLRGYRTEKETLSAEVALISKIAELEDHRAKLEDGNPCPLCGAEEHPFAEGNIPVLGEKEKKIEQLSKLIQNAEDQELGIDKLKAIEKEAQTNLTESEILAAIAGNEKKAAKKNLTDLAKYLKGIRSDYAKIKKKILTKLKPLGFKKLSESDVSSLLESLDERLGNWQNQVKQKTAIEKQISELDGEIKRLDAVIKTQVSTLAEKQKALDLCEKEYSDGNSQRQRLYKDKNPDTEELRLNNAISDTEQTEKQARIQNAEVQQKVNSAKANITSLEKQVTKRASELKILESNFITSLPSAGFIDEQQFIKARLSVDEREVLTQKAQELDHRQVDLKARREDRESRLAKELEKKITDNSVVELEPQYKELEESLKKLRDDIAELKHKLSTNEADKKRIAEKQTVIDAQQKECVRWDKLHGLIGSADGKKFRNFAQGLTFELMVSHANQQLEKMTDRYLLVRDDDQPLELNVVDNYQAGEIRSTKNLSGGESFIVSLTLALGLSKMASRKVRVDSLFLDEGFGTLDEETLETALETLSSLHQDGKLIGIISHIPALKERISTQISIDPISGGKSVITGPGCSRI